jgi:hypothetical protein
LAVQSHKDCRFTCSCVSIHVQLGGHDVTSALNNAPYSWTSRQWLAVTGRRGWKRRQRRLRLRPSLVFVRVHSATAATSTCSDCRTQVSYLAKCIIVPVYRGAMLRHVPRMGRFQRCSMSKVFGMDQTDRIPLSLRYVYVCWASAQSDPNRSATSCPSQQSTCW